MLSLPDEKKKMQKRVVRTKLYIFDLFLVDCFDVYSECSRY
jgi:hypothetical protein